ncbi:MAG: phosphoribosylanthranilate isomerase [Planctomycetota bacterium]|jgi:phosphoribosylanthranilate isomerase
MPARTRIKFCGLRDADGLAAAVAAGADMVGFVLAPGGPRSLDPATAVALRAEVPAGVDAVMVVRNQSEILGTLPPGVLAQLHGEETEADCAIAAGATGRPVIRAIGWDADAPERIRRFDACPHVGLLLIDATRPGSGEPIDAKQHAVLAATVQTCATPVGIAGGLDADNVGAIIRRLAPSLVDVSSGIESSRGVKDPRLMQAFAAAVRAADDAAG